MFAWPIVVSVPIKNICLSGEETKTTLLVPGACVIFTALFDVPDDKSQRYNAPSPRRANKSSPNVSKLQLVASRIKLDPCLASPQPSAPVVVPHVPVPQPKPYELLAAPTANCYFAFPDPPPPFVDPLAELVCVTV